MATVTVFATHPPNTLEFVKYTVRKIKTAIRKYGVQYTVENVTSDTHSIITVASTQYSNSDLSVQVPNSCNYTVVIMMLTSYLLTLASFFERSSSSSSSSSGSKITAKMQSRWNQKSLAGLSMCSL